MAIITKIASAILASMAVGIFAGIAKAEQVDNRRREHQARHDGSP